MWAKQQQQPPAQPEPGKCCEIKKARDLFDPLCASEGKCGNSTPGGLPAESRTSRKGKDNTQAHTHTHSKTRRKKGAREEKKTVKKRNGARCNCNVTGMALVCYFCLCSLFALAE